MSQLGTQDFTQEVEEEGAGGGGEVEAAGGGGQETDKDGDNQDLLWACDKCGAEGRDDFDDYHGEEDGGGLALCVACAASMVVVDNSEV